MPGTVPENVSKALNFHEAAPEGLSADEKHAWEQLDFFYKKGLGYANEMALRPQTLYALEDSPVGLASWILDHDAAYPLWRMRHPYDFALTSSILLILPKYTRSRWPRKKTLGRSPATRICSPRWARNPDCGSSAFS
jgi:hypothetical protein